jgi:hypothetical protein
MILKAKDRFWAFYTKRVERKEERYEYRQYWRGSYYTRLELDLCKRIGTNADRQDPDFGIPTLERLINRVDKTGIEYYECYFCREEKHIRNFSKHMVYRCYNYEDGHKSYPYCDKCELKMTTDSILEGYCNERIKPIEKDRRYIAGKLRKEGLPPQCRIPELIELERQILITKRELKNNY